MTRRIVNPQGSNLFRLGFRFSPGAPGAAGSDFSRDFARFSPEVSKKLRSEYPLLKSPPRGTLIDTMKLTRFAERFSKKPGSGS